MCPKGQHCVFELDLRGQLGLTKSAKKCPEPHIMPAFTNVAKRKIANIGNWFLIKLLLLLSKTLGFKSVLKTLV